MWVLRWGDGIKQRSGEGEEAWRGRVEVISDAHFNTQGFQDSLVAAFKGWNSGSLEKKAGRVA